VVYGTAFSYRAPVKAAIYREFQGPISVEKLEDPTPADDGVVIEVAANGVCRSDWHGWMGHDADITLPHVPGHELAGVVAAVGKDVRRFRVGDRVTVPFICGCGTCAECESGNQQVCPRQEQPGFTHWGAFAELVALRYADQNLVALPEAFDFATAAALGCRFATSYRAVVAQARCVEGEWLAVHGCGGVGLSAVMIAAARGVRVLAVDIDDDKLAFARSIGAAATLRADRVEDMATAVADLTGGGAHASIDALGGARTMRASIDSLRRRGRHVQVGLLVADESSPPVPMDRVVAHELELRGSHGLQAHVYPEMLEEIARGTMDPGKLIGRRVGLAEGVDLLVSQEAFADPGVTVIELLTPYS
jgi:alcohol dehydrogenase